MTMRPSGPAVRCLFAAWVLGAGACAPTISATVPPGTSRKRLEVDPTETRHCLRLASRFDERDAMVGPERAAVAASAIPASIQRVAAAADIGAVLAALISDPNAGPRSVELRLEIFTRLSSLEIQLSALLFEADCVGDQMEAVLDELARRQQAQEIGLAVASILVGAASGIGGGVYELRGRPPVGIPVISIVGGVAAAGLGLGAFAPVRAPIVFRHPRNLLAPILAGEDPDHLYPDFVFRMLTTPPADGGPTPQQTLVEDWRTILDDAVPASRRALAQEVIYGDGGVYDGDLVSAREQMYDALESQLNSIERELELLYRFADGVVGDPVDEGATP